MKECPLCKRGDIWQEAVCRTEQVYNGQMVKDGKEVIDYLLAEVQVMLEQAGVQQPTAQPTDTCKWKKVDRIRIDSPHIKGCYAYTNRTLCPTCGKRIEVVE